MKAIRFNLFDLANLNLKYINKLFMKNIIFIYDLINKIRIN